MSIITSLLDTDAYKFKMSNFLYAHPFGKVFVEYKFSNRTNINILDCVQVNDIRKEIDYLLSLTLRLSEMNYLKDTLCLDEDYIDNLNTHIHKNISIDVFETGTKRLKLHIKGPWWLATLYETPCLAIINELLCEKINSMLIYKHHVLANRNLHDKLELLKKNPKIRFVEFGTRRRFSLSMQRHIIHRMSLLNHKPMVGTSNVLLAKECGLKPMGTVAHEIPMGFAALTEAKDASAKEMRHSQIGAIEYYVRKYPNTYWLTDTYGSGYFLNSLSAFIKANTSMGLRQDSGDPLTWLSVVHNIYGTSKNLMFSDGLDIDTMINIYTRAKEYGFKDEQILFGWGTNLTNDGPIRPLSMVIKLSSVRLPERNLRRETCKLSDNTNKAFGSIEMIEYYKEIFEYEDNFTIEEDCRY